MLRLSQSQSKGIINQEREKVLSAAERRWRRDSCGKLVALASGDRGSGKMCKVVGAAW